MEYNKKSIIYVVIALIVVVSLMITGSYAYFSINAEGSGNDILVSTFDSNMEITFNDTSNISLVNAYTGESIKKTFNVKNTGDTVVYYDLLFKNLVNNFNNPSDLVYSLYSNDGGSIVINKIVPNEDNTYIASNVRIEARKTHNYELIITFLKTDKNQNNNMNKTFSTNIDVKSSRITSDNVFLYERNSLSYFVHNNNVLPYNEKNFNNEGMFYTNNSSNGNTIFFYRGGNNLNNNLIFANKCWKIIRTTESGNIKIIYNGEYIDGVCTFKNIRSKFNDNSDYNAYVGYLYGNASSGEYKIEHSNNNFSSVKKVLDSFYVSDLFSYNNFIANDTIFCNNRKTSEFTLNKINYGNSGYSKNNTGYLSFNNLYYNNRSDYDCINENDKISTSNGLNYPIGLISADEVYYAGINMLNNNQNNYLYIDGSYWTITPAYFNGSDAYNFVVNKGKLITNKVNTVNIIRPVIALKGNIKVVSGDGSIDNPYRV